MCFWPILDLTRQPEFFVGIVLAIVLAFSVVVVLLLLAVVLVILYFKCRTRKPSFTVYLQGSVHLLQWGAGLKGNTDIRLTRGVLLAEMIKTKSTVGPTETKLRVALSTFC